MIVRQSGEFEVEQGPQEVFALLSDPSRFGPLLPGFEGVETGGDDEWILKLRVGVSHLKGTAKVRLKRSENDPPRHAAYRGHGSLLGGTVRLAARFSLQPSGGGTAVDWNGEAQVAGRLAGMARGLLEPLARRNIDSLINAIREALSG